jgi:PAS domain S-box-containing protein
MEALADSEERFRLAFESSPLGVLFTSLDSADLGAFRWANPAICAMTGYTAAELTGGMSFRQLQHPDDHASSGNLLARLVSGELDRFRMDRRYLAKDGGTLEVTLHIAVVRDARTGRPRYLVTQVEDVTDRRRARRQLEAQATLLEERNAALEAANRLKLDLIGMLGHEIGNPLSVILGYTELATESWPVFD